MNRPGVYKGSVQGARAFLVLITDISSGHQTLGIYSESRPTVLQGRQEATCLLSAIAPDYLTAKGFLSKLLLTTVY